MAAADSPPLPGPRETPLAQLARLRKDFLAYLLDAATHGDLVLLRPAPGAHIVLVNHPDLVHEILVSRPQDFAKSRMTRRLVGKFLGQGLVLAEGEHHRRDRRQVQPAFHGPRLAGHARAIAEITARSVSSWLPGSTIDVDAEMTRLTMRVVARTLFGVRAGEDDAGVGEAMSVFAASMAQRFRRLPLPDWLPLPRHRRERRAIAALDHAIAQILDRPQMPDGDDLLSMLRQSRDDGGAAFSAKQIRDHIATLYFAGHETTAKLLGWTLWLLAQHPETEAALRTELAVLQDAWPDAEALNALPLLDATIKEALRLYPPAWVFDREARRDLELGGHRIAAGTTLYLSPYVIQCDARWFAEPQRFDPARFLPGAPPVPRFAYFPFGYGPRNCIGRGLAELNAKATLSALLRRVQLRPVSGAPVAPSPEATLRPRDGLHMQVLSAPA